MTRKQQFRLFAFFAAFAVCSSLLFAQDCPIITLTIKDAGTGEEITNGKIAMGQGVTATIPEPGVCCAYKDIEWKVTLVGTIVQTQIGGTSLSWTAPLDPPQGGSGYSINVKGKKKPTCGEGGGEGPDVWEDFDVSASGNLYCACGFDNCPDDAAVLCGCHRTDMDCPCGGEYCTDKDGPGPGVDKSCNRQCNQITQTPCGAGKQGDGTWNEEGRKLCSANGCQGSDCECGRYHCKRSTAGPPDVKSYSCACWDCNFNTCSCGTEGECGDSADCRCRDCDFAICVCWTPGECGSDTCELSDCDCTTFDECPCANPGDCVSAQCQ